VNTVNTDGLKMVPRVPPPAPRAQAEHIGSVNPDAE
jgi:hypothetical protein